MERIAVAVVALLVVAAGALAPAVAADPDDESASFEDGYVTVTRGDSVDIAVSHSTAANLTIGSESDDGFEVRVPLGGSGTDTVTFDTYNTTSTDPADFLSVDGAELVSDPIDEAIEPGEYRLSVSVDGTELARSTLEVEPRRETTATMGVAPSDLDFADSDVSGVFDAVTERDTVARGDYAVALVNESGLSWALPDASTDGYLADDLEVSVAELDPEPNTEAEEYDEDVVASRVSETDQFAVFWEASVPVTRNSNNTYELRLTLEESSDLVAEDEVLVRERVRVGEPTVELSGSPSFTLAPWDESHLPVTGETNLAPTSLLDVRVVQASPNEHIYRNVVAVNRDGTFDTAFNLSMAEVPQELPLYVQDYRDESEETVSLSAANASLSFPDQRAEAGAVSVSDVSLSHGGFVELSRQVNNTSSTVGVSAQLDAGDHDTVSIPLVEPLENETELTATAVADANRNATLDDGDVPYEMNGTVVAANATVRPAPEPENDTSPTTTPTPTNETNTTTTPPTSTTQRSLDVEESDPLAPNRAGGGGGGSGGTVPLSPALVVLALAATALLAGRR
jgi:hypothetical protein